MATRNAESSSSRGSLSRVADDDDTICVAVGKDFEENKLNLLWALENFPGKKFRILHVHQPSKIILLVGGKVPANRLNQHELREYQEFERKITHNILDDYLALCHQVEVHDAEKLWTEIDDVGRGIVELLFHHGIKRLVMGAAANKYYSEEMMELKSRKAIYVQRRVPHSCQILYVCNGYHINTWEGGSTSSATNGFGNLESVLHHRTEGVGLELELLEVTQSEEDAQSCVTLEGSNVDQLYSQLEQAMLEAEKYKQEAFEESLRRGKAEKTAIKAVCRAKALENLYAEELRSRKETEEALAREKEDHQRTKNRWNEERLVTMDQRLLQQIQVSDFDHKTKELEDEIFAAQEQCKEYKKERDALQVELDDVLGRQVNNASSSRGNRSVSDFFLTEIEEATSNFDPLLRIGESEHATTYKGTVRQTTVVIKVLNPDSIEGPIQFQQEVDLMSKVRHPSVVILVGVCSEANALIYEYLQNGSLEDRLNCKDNTSPLPWQARIVIATEVCSALIFLHSSPRTIVHGDLKTGNILLDANLTCKLSYFGGCRINSLLDTSRDTFHHLDPHFLTTGELSPSSDIYSFGIVLLQLLTGRSAFRIVNAIRDVINEGTVSLYLDDRAGDWSLAQAKKLTRLALKCCDPNPNNRPDLVSEVWRVLDPMRDDCSTSLQYGSQDREQPPPYFICPITQEVMEDPQVAADGFTYEAADITRWLESGQDRSPLTNVRLSHLNLVPNHALRSEIQQWQQRH